jgi:hypothetical protein
MSRSLLDGSSDTRAAAIAALATRAAAPNAAELDALRECLGDAAKLVQRRAAEAFGALAARGVEVEDWLRAALDAGDLRQRWGAAYAWSLVGGLPADALPTLLAVMGADDGDLRWAAADLVKLLAHTAHAAVVARLLEAAGAPGTQRKMALYCLRDLMIVEGWDVALQALADEHIEARLAALSLMASVHPNATVAAQRIAALIDDRDPRMQRAAAGTLGKLAVRSDEVVAALRRAEASDDPSLRRAASQSLRTLVG